MAKKRYTAEAIIGHLRRAEVMVSQGRSMDEVVARLVLLAIHITAGARNTVAWA
jgi:hypothetical protein